MKKNAIKFLALGIFLALAGSPPRDPHHKLVPRHHLYGRHRDQRRDRHLLAILVHSPPCRP
jgi:hypothetical protein